MADRGISTTHRPDAVRLRHLRLLIARAKTLSDPERMTQESELYKLKESAESCLAELGPRVERTCWRVSELSFRPRITANRVPPPFVESYAYRKLDELHRLLRVALKGSAKSLPSRTKRSASPLPLSRSRTHSYSKQDAQLFELLGATPFETLTNPEMRQRYLPRIRKELSCYVSGNAFRASLNRIRRHHGFPSSDEIRRTLSIRHPQ